MWCNDIEVTREDDRMVCTPRVDHVGWIVVRGSLIVVGGGGGGWGLCVCVCVRVFFVWGGGSKKQEISDRTIILIRKQDSAWGSVCRIGEVSPSKTRRKTFSST